MSQTRDLLARHGLRAKKSWGQNFLVDVAAQKRIVGAAAVTAEDLVVEIGAGLGALTGHLAEAAGKVIAIERDPDLVEVLRQELGNRSNVEILAADAMEVDFARLGNGRPLVVVGNLPYQITSPLLFAILDAAAGGAVIARAVVMIQREVAERVTARAGTDDYGRLSVMAQQRAEVEILFHVGAGAFHPQPTVTSTVMRIVPRAVALAPVREPAVFEALVRGAFAARRKMLRRALGAVFGDEVVRRALVRAGIEGTRRGEELAVSELGRLADAIVEERGEASDA